MKAWVIAFIILSILIIAGLFLAVLFDTRNSSLAEYIPERCIISTPFGCSDSSLDISGITFSLQNIGEKTVEINSFEIDGCNLIRTKPILPNTLHSGEDTIFNFYCNLNSGEKFTSNIKVIYNFPGNSTQMQAAGMIVGRIR